MNATNVTSKQTALHVAACEGNTRILEHLLLHCKVDPDVTDGKGKTALQLVIANRQSIKTASEYSPRTLAVSAPCVRCVCVCVCVRVCACVSGCVCMRECVLRHKDRFTLTID